LAHPAVLRRLAFSHWEINNMREAHRGGGYGRVMPSDLKGDIVLPAEVWASGWTLEESKKKVEDWLKQWHYTEV